VQGKLQKSPSQEGSGLFPKRLKNEISPSEARSKSGTGERGRDRQPGCEEEDRTLKMERGGTKLESKWGVWWGGGGGGVGGGFK